MSKTNIIFHIAFSIILYFLSVALATYMFCYGFGYTFSWKLVIGAYAIWLFIRLCIFKSEVKIKK